MKKKPEEKAKKEKNTGEGRRYTTEQHPRSKRRIRMAEQGREGQGELAPMRIPALWKTGTQIIIR